MINLASSFSLYFSHNAGFLRLGTSFATPLTKSQSTHAKDHSILTYSWNLQDTVLDHTENQIAHHEDREAVQMADQTDMQEATPEMKDHTAVLTADRDDQVLASEDTETSETTQYHDAVIMDGHGTTREIVTLALADVSSKLKSVP
jgi:hypothetical protein